MADYAAETDIEALLDYPIDAGSRPSTTSLAVYLSNANIIINNFLCIETDLTGNSATAMKPYACALVMDMINNMFAMAEPENYGRVEVMLTDQDKAEIMKIARKWKNYSWKMGID